MGKIKNLKLYNKCLIVVDMVNGFVREGIMADSYIEHIIPEQIRLIKEFLEKKEGIAFVKESHSKDCMEFKTFPEHCVKGTREAELVDELKPFEKDALVYEKNSTSAMIAKNFLRDIGEMINLRNIVITGCCTDICDLNLAIPLKNYFNEYNTTVHFISHDELLKNHSKLPHGGFVIGVAETSENIKQVAEFSLKLDSNPEFTSSVLISYGRATYRMWQEGYRGCKNFSDVAPKYLSNMEYSKIIETIL